MLAEIITIGDELLIGQTVDTNSAWLGAELAKIGVTVYQVTSIPDERERILQALANAESRVQLVLMTGGLGPTTDDITKPTLCAYFNTTLERNTAVLQEIEGFFTRAGLPLLEVNRQQADLPKACTVLRNARGTASGMWFEQNDTVFVSMPGVPHEMKGIMQDEVFERVAQRFDRPAIVHRTIMTQGQGESFIAQRIADWAEALPAKGIKLAYLPGPGQVRIRLSASGPDAAALTRVVDAEKDALVALIPDIVYGFDNVPLWQVVGELLVASGATVSTAESCTGGTIAQLLTQRPGSSAFFQGGVVAYANEVKMHLLGVQERDLIAHGAVSQAVVEQMARGVREALGTTYAVATSGVAGPDGGSDEKPVGTVWMAVAGPDGVESVVKTFSRSRERNIQRATLYALDLLRKKIQG